MKGNCSFTEQLKNPFMMAPLAGITDKSMRTLCLQQGASLTFTEMVSGKGLKYGDRKTRQLLELTSLEARDGLPAYQLFGDEPEILRYAVRELSGDDNAAFDLNCGCPATKIVKNGEGSALLKRLDVLHDCVRAMVDGARDGAGEPKPVTAKIRMGFARGENVAVEAAKAIEAAGAAAVTVHGRTREQNYEGKADWKVIADVKAAVKIPVIGNGDIRSGADAIRMMRETGCDAVMIARGALGNPWIFRDALCLWEAGWTPREARGDATGSDDREAEMILREMGAMPPSAEERIEMAVKHLEMACEDKGERIALKEMRKVIGHYTRGIQGAVAIRRGINTAADFETVEGLLRSLLV